MEALSYLPPQRVDGVRWLLPEPLRKTIACTLAGQVVSLVWDCLSAGVTSFARVPEKGTRLRDLVVHPESVVASVGRPLYSLRSVS